MLYHATFLANVESITQYGLGNCAHMHSNWDCSYAWNAGRPEHCVYLACTEQDAIGFAETVDEDKVPDSIYYSGIVLLCIDDSQLDANLLCVDPNLLEDEEKCFLYKGIISPEAIVHKTHLSW